MEYDPYGIAAINPIRYRGYYYDTETGLYYLKSRYYDPEIGRFITIDDISYIDPDTINGLNLYAYCGNNPINYLDYDGRLGIFLQALFSVISYIGMVIAAIFDKDVRNDMKAINWNPFNTDESSVLSSQKVSFYKGVPVFRTNANRSGTFLGIWLDRSSDNKTVRHEFGHTIQHDILGTIPYLLYVLIPSAAEFGHYKRTTGDYYNSPVETMADMFGGVGRGQATGYKIRAIANLITAFFLGPVSYLLFIH